MGIQTNRDLYLAIAALSAAPDLPQRPLEAYLRALWALAAEIPAAEGIAPAAFFALLSDAFSAAAPAFDEAWRQRPAEGAGSLQGYAGWQDTILRQIVDLREMGERGMLADKQKFFGINSPRGHRWYNFSPRTFLECALAGTYGGWAPGDETGRTYVPGQVAVLNEAGDIESHDPDTLPNPVYPLGPIGWDDFREFLLMGQLYE